MHRFYSLLDLWRSNGFEDRDPINPTKQNKKGV